jgi:heme A synthase
VFGIGLLLVGWQLLRSRREAPGVVRLALTLLTVLLTQMAVGEIQYRNALPWGLVLAHVTLAATIWALTVGVVYALWRPPLALVAPAAARSEPLGEPLRSR